MDEPRILIKRGLRTAVTGPVTASLMAFPRGAFSSQTIETTDSARVLVLRQSAKQTFLSRFAVGPTSRATFRGLASGPAARIGAVSPGVTHHTAGACRCGLVCAQAIGVAIPISSARPRRPTTFSIDLFGLIAAATFPPGQSEENTMKGPKPPTVRAIASRADDTYLVRITRVGSAASPFIWEICSHDGLLVLLRSRKTFRTQIEALFDSTASAARLELSAGDGSPCPEPP